MEAFSWQKEVLGTSELLFFIYIFFLVTAHDHNFIEVSSERDKWNKKNESFGFEWLLFSLFPLLSYSVDLSDT